MRILWAFRCNPSRSGSSEPSQEIACGNFLGEELPKAILRL
jgi:hypothetical protein